MKTKHVLLIIYSIILFYLGYKIRGYFSADPAENPDIVADTALFEKWDRRTESEKSSNSRKKNTAKPKAVKYQSADSIMNSRIKDYAGIVEVKKKKDVLEILSYHNSKLVETSFISGTGDFIVTNLKGVIKYSEEKKFLQFEGIKIGLGGKIDMKTGRKLYFAEAGTGLVLFNSLKLDLRLNSIPELTLALNYTLN